VATAGQGYKNATKGFESCLLSFKDGARIEVVSAKSVALTQPQQGTQPLGLTHLAICVGVDADLDTLAQRLCSDGVPVVDGPRRTGDGYYEAVALDPDGNRIEICAEREDL
jgi:lactoylglutathione lyase